MSTYRLEFVGKVYSLLLWGAFVVGQREVDIAVYGNSVAKTDIATYTVFNTFYGIDDTTSLTIICTSFVRVSSTIDILRNGSILSTTQKSSNHTYRIVFKEVYDKSNVTSSQGKYSCRLNIAFQANDGSLSYCLESEIQIKTTTSSLICASNIGFHGYVGEKVTLTCEGYLNTVNFFQGELLKSRYFLQGNLLENNTEVICTTVTTIGEQRQHRCPKKFTVERSLEVKLTPGNFTIESNNTTFFCESTPGRLLYWKIIGKDGNILDLHKLDQFRLHTNVIITQKAGWSSLQISALGANKVNKIVCSTYGTRIRAVAYATLASIPEDDKTCLCNVPSSTLDPVSTFPPQTTMLTDKNNEQSSSEEEISTHSFELTGTAKEGNTDLTQPLTSPQTLCPDVNRTEQEANGNSWITYFVIAIAVWEAILLLTITCNRCHSKKKDPKKPSSTSENTNNIISSETEMHDNFIYQQYQ